MRGLLCPCPVARPAGVDSVVTVGHPVPVAGARDDGVVDAGPLGRQIGSVTLERELVAPLRLELDTDHDRVVRETIGETPAADTGERVEHL
jgi:hypothetical protein